MSYTYSSWITQFSNLLVYGSTDANFLTMSQGAIDYGEQRLYRDLDLLATRITDATTTVSSGNRNFTLPTGTGTYLVVEGINTISPVGLSATSSGSRNPVTFTSRDVIDVFYPSNSVVTGVPIYAAMASNTQVILGPAPDAGYTAEVIGTQRPTALSSSNTTTILTTMLPDLWMAVTMIYGTGFQRDFGGQADDPNQSQSWENMYQTLINSANVEELRKRYQSQGWTNQFPNPIATPQRA